MNLNGETANITVFAVGSGVNYGPDFNLYGVVARVAISRDSRVEYEVEYWQNGELKTLWLHAELVKPVQGTKQVSLGFGVAAK